MSLPKKILSALRLLLRLDFATLHRQWRHNEGYFILRRKGTDPFVDNRLGFPATCHPDWPDSVYQFLNNEGDVWEYDLLAHWLEPGDQFLDIGANLGLYSFAALPVVGPGGQVVAVDAAPYVIAKLEQSAKLLGASNLCPVQAAITDCSGETSFYVTPNASITGMQSLRPAGSQRAQSVQVAVPALTLSDLQERQNLDSRLSFVKMDIEGAEAPALRTTPPAWLAADGPFWIVEINPEALARFGATPQRMLAHFPPEHFECWLLSKSPWNPKDPCTLRPANATARFDDSFYYNLFAIPRGSRWQKRISRIIPFFPDTALRRIPTATVLPAPSRT